MQKETRSCQNCKKDFLIEPEDFDFYQKMKVPAPTWCPDCRMQRRMLWRNELILYRRKSSFSGEDIISQHPSNAPFPVYSISEFYSRRWQVPHVDYDSGRNFFEQFHELQLQTPRRALLTDLQSIENRSMYQNAASRNKDCYLVFAAGDDEDCMYGYDIDRCRSVLDSSWTRRTEYSYECVDVLDSNRVFFSEECRECVDCWFLYDCKNCLNCFGCVGLRNASYCIWNKQFTKEDYEIQIKEILSNLTQLSIKEYRLKLEGLSRNHPHKFAHIDVASIPTCTGDYIVNSERVRYGFSVYESQNVRYVAKLINARECWDVSDWGDPAEMCYESITVGDGAYRVLFSSDCWPNCREVQYCDSCADAHNLFGCVGLKNASYCILNKQYSKEEYEKLVPLIIGQMSTLPYIDSFGRVYKYGEYFPSSFSPFSYNDTMAQDHFPLTEDMVLEKGYRWAQPEDKNYEATLLAEDIIQRIGDVDDSILSKVIACAHKGSCKHRCATAFRILPQELLFYRRFGIPIPWLCFYCRNSVRMKRRNPLRLWSRACDCNRERDEESKNEGGVYENTTQHFHKEQHCPHWFETSYAPDGSEIVYCEKCYQAEVS